MLLCDIKIKETAKSSTMNVHNYKLYMRAYEIICQTCLPVFQGSGVCDIALSAPNF